MNSLFTINSIDKANLTLFTGLLQRIKGFFLQLCAIQIYTNIYIYLFIYYKILHEVHNRQTYNKKNAMAQRH